MVKSQNEIKDSLKLIDIVVEVLDARIPMSSRNPLINELAKNKARIIVLNKKDFAEEKNILEWEKYFKNQNISCIAINTYERSDINKLIDNIKKLGNIIYEEKNKNKNIEIKPTYRVLVVGIPNVGKSTIINKIAGKNISEVGNKPGVTKRKQWIRVASNIDLLDTPGLLWPKIDDNEVGLKLALTGNIKQDVLDVEEIACKGIELILKLKKEYILEKYNLDSEILSQETYEILENIGRKRGCIISGGNVDMTKAAKCFLDDLKNGKLGKISLDKVSIK